MLSFKLQKLKIGAFAKEDRSGEPDDTFEAMFNPESYSLKYQNVYQESQSVNTDGQRAKYSRSRPNVLSVKLILDGTGAAEYAITPAKDIYKEVKRFLELTCIMDGAIHEPKYLKLEWGDLVFDCRLVSVDIKYTLFNRNGQPLRAELSTEFKGDLQLSKRVQKESADLTHVRTIKSSDILPLIAYEIYNDSSFYIQIAQTNGLNNFRKLRTGETLHFPPMKK